MAKKKQEKVEEFDDGFDDDFKDDSKESNEYKPVLPVIGEPTEDEVRLLRQLEALNREMQREAEEKRQCLAEFKETNDQLVVKREALLGALMELREERELGIQKLPFD